MVSLEGNTSSGWLSKTVSKNGYKFLGIIGFAVGTNTGILFNQIYPENNAIIGNLALHGMNGVNIVVISF